MDADAAFGGNTGWSRDFSLGPQRPRRVYLLVAGIACAVYLNAIPNDFAYDDDGIIVENNRIHSPLNLRQIWMTDWWYVPPERSEERHRDRLYRPLVIHTFALNYAISGNTPWTYHVVDILLHAVTCIIVVALTRRLFQHFWMATWTGVLFAVLPVHTEAVSHIVGRADVLAGMFCLLGVLLLILEREALNLGPRRVLRSASLLCIPLGLFCKEQAICLPVLMILTDWYLNRRGRIGMRDETAQKAGSWWLRRAACFYSGAILLVATYMVMRYVALDSHLLRDQHPSPLDNPISHATPVERVWTPFKILAQYLLVTVWPANLSSDYSLNSLPLAGSLLDVKALCGFLVVLGAIWTAFQSARRTGTLFYAIAFFVLSYGLISNTVLVIGTIMGERLFYLPSLAVCWLAVIGTRALFDLVTRLDRGASRAGRMLRVAAALILGVMALRTVLRNADWRSDEYLFQADLLIQPGSARLQLFNAKTLITRRDYEGAREHLRRCLEIFPEFAHAHASMGYVYAVTGDWTNGKKHFWLALQLLWENPTIQAQYENFRRFYEQGEGVPPEGKLSTLMQAAKADPGNAEAQLDLAELQAGLGRYRDAIATLEASLKLNPADRPIRHELTRLYMIDEQDERAAELLTALLAEDEEDWQAHAHMAYLRAARNPQAALSHARRAATLQPERFEVRMNLVQALLANNRTAEALSELEALKQVIPEDEPARLLVQRQIQLIQEER